MSRLNKWLKGLWSVGIWRSQLGLSYAPTSQKMNVPTIPYLSIRPNYIALYSLPESPRVRSALQRKTVLNLAQNEHFGKISKKANRRIRQAIDWLLYLSQDKTFYHNKFKKTYKFKVNFITLTLAAPQQHSDQVIKKLVLQPFLDYGRKVWKIDKYVWRAEPQKNGNIHFHIVTDVYIPWVEIRNCWNRLQGKLGYISRYQNRFPGKTPNSTDVHSVRKIRNLSTYLAKYCAKESTGRPIKGKQWGLSYKLSRLKSAVDVRYSDIDRELRGLIKICGDKVKRGDYHTCIFVKVSEWIGQGFAVLEHVFQEYLLHAFDPPEPVPVPLPGAELKRDRGDIFGNFHATSMQLTLDVHTTCNHG